MPWTQLFDPVALAIVGGGTLLAVILRTPAADLARAVAALRTLARRRTDAEPMLAQLAAQARIAQRHGIAVLDRSIIADPDLARAITAICDGRDADEVETMVRHARLSRIQRHAAAADVWASAAEVAPTMGMVGTLVGLARMFATMSDPAAIGGAMAIALLATLYGALLSALLFTPVAARLRALGRTEAFERARIEAPLVALARRETPRPPLASAA